MSETTETLSIVEPPPFAQEGVFTDDAAWDQWTENSLACIAWHVGWTGGGYGYSTTAEAKIDWPACPGDNWIEADYCDVAKYVLQREGKELHGEKTYRSVMTASMMVGPDQTKDGWVRVGSCSAGSTCEVQVDDEGTMRTTDIDGSISVYECPQEYECRVTQCTSDYLDRGADTDAGEVLIMASLHNESTLEDVLDGLETSLKDEDIPIGSEGHAGDAVRTVIAGMLGVTVGEDGIADDDLAKVWDADLEHGPDDEDVGVYVYVYVKPA